MTEPRVIKRYSNRKLYDTLESRYVTLEQVAALVQSGEDIRIVDNQSKEDLTRVTLAHILLANEKKQSRLLPMSTLRSVIESKGEQLQEFARSVRQNAEKILRPTPSATDTEGQLGEERPFLRSVLDLPQRTLDELQRRVDERIKTTLHSLTTPLAALQRELREISNRLEALEKKLVQHKVETTEQTPSDTKTEENK
jgi:polyhydroxyalkanoate synthesis repressor PhaR